MVTASIAYRSLDIYKICILRHKIVNLIWKTNYNLIKPLYLQSIPFYFEYFLKISILKT